MRFLKSILFSLVLGLSVFNTVEASALTTMKIFYSPTCPHCRHAKEFIKDYLQEEYPEVVFEKHDVSQRHEANLMQHYASKLNIFGMGVPTIIVGDDYVQGYRTSVTDNEYRRLLDMYVSSAEKEYAAKIRADRLVQHEHTDTKEQRIIKDEVVDAGIFGKVNVLEKSLTGLSVVLGLVDGFNPCAMWVLVFMIGIILELKCRKKIWTIVGTFVVASGILYFLFMTVWFNAFRVMGQIGWVQQLVGVLALYMGYKSIKDFIKGDVECEIGDMESRSKTRTRIQRIIDAPMNIALFISIVGLAFTVNAVEFACSLGLPAVYTAVLAQADLSVFAYYGYIALYVFFYMLDDLIIFSLAALAVDKFVGDGYVKYCKLIGGVILILLAVMMIFFPDALR